eukprot:m51a1_g4270 hypothetical protein (378) ;mRNA; r:302196-303711
MKTDFRCASGPGAPALEHLRFGILRICRSDESNPTFPGRFLPNYLLSSAGSPILSAPFPLSRGTRDDTYKEWVSERAGMVAQVARATGLVYAGVGTPGTPWDHCASATFFLLEHEGAVVGVTAFHLLQRLGASQLEQVKLYVCPGAFDYDMTDLFATGLVSGLADFVPVELRRDLVARRFQYVCRVAESPDDPLLVEENLEPLQRLQVPVAADVLFFTPPPELLSLGLPRMAVSPSPPVLSIGFQDIRAAQDGEVYRRTMHSPPDPRRVAYPHRSLTVVGVNAGAVDTQNTLLPRMGGSPLLDASLRVVGVASAAFSDAVHERSARAGAVHHEGSPLYCSVDLEEGEGALVEQSRNFNTCLSVGHSYFREALSLVRS